jgi:predicted nucleotidyltransferase
MDEKGVCLTVANKQARDVNFIRYEGDEKVTIVVYYSQSGVFNPVFVILMGTRCREIYNQNLRAGTQVRVTDSGCMDENISRIVAVQENVY